MSAQAVSSATGRSKNSATDDLRTRSEAHTGAHGDDAGAAQALRLCQAEDPSDTAWQGGDAAADDEE